jgi:hypothetical protein
MPVDEIDGSVGENGTLICDRLIGAGDQKRARGVWRSDVSVGEIDGSNRKGRTLTWERLIATGYQERIGGAGRKGPASHLAGKGRVCGYDRRG